MFAAFFAAAILALLAMGNKAMAPLNFGPNHLATPADVEPHMPPEILAIVNRCLLVETSGNRMRDFATTLEPYYPKAAAILFARAIILAP